MRALAVFFLSVAAYAAPPLATLAGTVVDDRDGKPIEGAKVELYFGKGTQKTGPDGRFEFANVTPDSYQVDIEHPGHAKLRTPAILLSAGQTIANYTIRLQPEAILSGRVTGATGSVSLTLTDAASGTFVTTKFTPDGRFELRGLPAGRYKLSAEADRQPKTFFPSTLSRDLADVIELAPGAHREGIEIRLITQSLHALRGRFTGQIPEGARASVAAEKITSDRSGRLPSALLEAGGRFELQLAPGGYRLKVSYFPQGAGQQPVVLGFCDLTVTGAPLNDIVIPPSQIRSVRVRFRSPAPKTNVALNPTAGLGILQWSNRQPDGTLLIEQISPDIYSFRVGSLPPNTYIRSILAAGADITAAGLDLITGTATDLEIILATDGATLTGQVLDSANQPVNSGTVYLSRPNASRPLRELYSYQATVNATGQFTIPAIAPGEYSVSYRAASKSQPLATINATPRAQLQLKLHLP